MKDSGTKTAGGGTVGVRELKNRLTHYLKVVGKGNLLVVTDRGKPVAVMSSVETGAGGRTLDERLALLASRGDIALPSKNDSFKTLKPVRTKGTPASRLVSEERR
ncbi:MAG: type II toxin-antitoxin system Phd/YefM family antitoxin [Nitrospinae bacterium]|nr:type II toxin-antitoxin system Phd/YefM family antitoxin [Nitrospinota bacterium]